jgi:ribonuclease R
VTLENDEILGALPPSPQTVRIRDLMRRLKLPASDRSELKSRLESLVAAGLLLRVGARRYTKPRSGELVIGTLTMTRRGFGFVGTEDDRADVYIRGDNIGPAMHRDRVQVRIISGSRGRSEGLIVAVVEHGTKTFVGFVHRARKAQWVTPRDERLPDRINLIGNAEHGQLIGARFTAWAGPSRSTPEAEVIRVFADEGTAASETELVVYELGLPTAFSPETRAHVEGLDEALEPLVPDSRVDLRGRAFFTVDPQSARDFDDAVCAEIQPGGGWRLSVAVADVSHYVQPDTPVDLEAYERSFSVYLPDRVLPMLPERLSGDLCSLRPMVDRYAMVVEAMVTPDGEIHSFEVKTAIIRSRLRLSYDQCAEALNLISDPLVISPEDTSELLPTMHAVLDVTRVLRRRRAKRGYLALDIPESSVQIDESGQVEALVIHKRHEAHLMVEEAMLAANECVARFFVERGIPSLFRVHAEPPKEGLSRLWAQAKALQLNIPQHSSAGQLSEAINRLKDHPNFWLANMLLLRSMARAEYLPTVEPHYGLGFDAYLHFTSPIRRYTDLTVHRLIKAVLHSDPDRDWNMDKLLEIARHCSRRERLVLDAEREVVGMYKALFMEQYIHEELTAVISGMTANGLFIYFDTTQCDGFVPLKELRDDWFDMNDTKTALVGRNTGTRYQLGDRILTVVTEVSVRQRQVTARCLGPYSPQRDSSPKNGS